MVPTSAHARPRDRWTEHSNRLERLRLRLRLRCSVTWESVGWSLPVTVTPYPRKGRPTRIAAHTIPMRSIAFERAAPSSSIAYVSTHQRKHAFTFVVRGGSKGRTVLALLLTDHFTGINAATGPVTSSASNVIGNVIGNSINTSHDVVIATTLARAKSALSRSRRVPNSVHPARSVRAHPCSMDRCASSHKCPPGEYIACMRPLANCI